MSLRAHRRRRRLEARAYPDPFVIQGWRRRTKVLLAAAFVLAVLHLYWPALLVVVISLPNLLRYVAQQLALGKLMRMDRERPAPETPALDARAVFRRHR